MKIKFSWWWAVAGGVVLVLLARSWSTVPRGTVAGGTPGTNLPGLFVPKVVAGTQAAANPNPGGAPGPMYQSGVDSPSGSGIP